MLKLNIKKHLFSVEALLFTPARLTYIQFFLHPCQQLCCTNLIDRRKPPKKIQQTHIDLLIYMSAILVTSDYINSVDWVSGYMAN